MFLGLVFSAAIALVAFEWKTYEKPVQKLADTGNNTIEQEQVPPSQRKPPPPPPPPQPTTAIKIVEDEKHVENQLVMQNLDVTQNTVIEPIQQKHEEVKEEKVFTIVEQMPSFPGGEEALMKYLADNIQYPAIAKDAGIQGRVYVTFVVDKDGSITDVKVLRGIGGGCDEEAVRVVKNMPKWNPGKQRGKPVKVQYNLPIRYTLR